MIFADWLPSLGITGGVILFLGLSFTYYCLRTGVPTFPSMPVAREKIIDLLCADAALQGSELPYTVVDLGSGSGQLSWHIARAMPQAQVVGIELSFFPWARSVLWQKLTRQTNLRYLRVDFWTYDISETDAVLTYLMEAIMPRVSLKLRHELRSNALVISNKFPLPGWKPQQVIPLQSAFSKQLLVYRQVAAVLADDTVFDEPTDVSHAA